MSVRFLEDLHVDGNVGIGTTSPSSTLTISQTNDTGIKLIGYDDRDDASANIYIDSGGNLKINNTNGSTSGYIIVQAENYLNLSASSFVYFTSNVRVYDNNQFGFGSGNDLVIQHDGSHSYISQGGTGNLYIQQNTDDADIVFQSDDGSGGTETYFFLDGSNGVVNFPDNKRLTFGTDRDLFLYHDGTNATFKNYVGDIVIQNEANDKDIIFKSDDGSGGLTDYLTIDGGTTHAHFSNPGNVGIGTTSPQSLLHVHTGDGGTYSPNSSHDDLTIEGSGNVGLQLFSPNSSYQYIAFGDPQSVNAGYIRYHHGSNTMALRTNNQDRVSINSSGNVGIGTTSPAKKLDVNGDTNITGYLDLKTSSPTGSPLLRFYQSTTRRGFIQMADTNNNLRVASEYGSVSLEAAATSGVDSDTSYIRIKPGGTVEIGAVDGDATISTDGSMTFKIDADNDETSQKFSFVNNAGTEVASIDESGNLTLTGGISLSLPSSPGATGTLWNDRGIVRYVE